MYSYHFGVSGPIISIMHMIFGLFFVYLGYLIVNRIDINTFIGMFLMAVGLVVTLYHLYIMVTFK